MTREIIENDTGSQGVVESPIDTSIAYGGSDSSRVYRNIVDELKTYYSPGKTEAEEVGEPSLIVEMDVAEVKDVESSISSARGNIIRMSRIRKLSFALSEEEKKAA